MTVRELTGSERDRIYAEHALRYPGFAEYERQTAGIRVIPVLELRACLETSWYRWVTVATLAWPSLALTEHARPPLAEMIALTRNGIAGVAAAPYQPARW